VTASRCASRKGAHLAFGDIAAGWSLLSNLDVAAVIVEVVGGRRSDAEASVGTYVSMAALGRLVAALEEGIRRVVGRHLGGPVHPDRREGP
jgi:hypothetical protein